MVKIQEESGESHAEVSGSHPVHMLQNTCKTKRKKYNHVEKTHYIYAPCSDHGG